MNTWGNQVNGKPRNIAIKNPLKANEILSIVPLAKGAIVTSGSYEKFVELDGKRYSYIINPKSGYPATSVLSVTLFGPSAEIVNGFSTYTIVFGKKKGIELIKKCSDDRYLIITDEGEIIKNLHQ